MEALLGKITNVKQLKGTSSDALRKLEVAFKPACLLPERTQAPEWLKDQVLKITREVADPREVGSVGDSVVAGVAESAPYLRPLVVEPELTQGRIPERLRVRLLWWKDDKPGEFTVCANGRRRTGKFRRRGDAFVARMATGDFLDSEPKLPLAFEVTFGKLTAACTVLPRQAPYHCAFRTSIGKVHRLESEWYVLDVTPLRGGGIRSLREKGRDVDHFQADDSMVGRVLEAGGHRDLVSFGWNEKLGAVQMDSASARREAGAARLQMEGVLDKDRNMRTSVAFTLFDTLPLVLIERNVHAGKPQDKKNEGKDKKPKEPIDDVQPVSLGFRAACRLEPENGRGSRIVSVDKERLAVVRATHMHDTLWNGWWLRGGWALMEHGGRAECLIYAFDGSRGPILRTWRGHDVMTLEPRWLPEPVRPEGGTAFALALAAGELCGAELPGAWVAARRPVEDGVECAVVARFPDGPPEPVAEFRLHRKERRAPMERLLVPGAGTLYVARTHFPGGKMKQALHLNAGGLPARREP